MEPAPRVSGSRQSAGTGLTEEREADMDETRELSYVQEVRSGWAVRVFRLLARSRMGRRLIQAIMRSALGEMR